MRDLCTFDTPVGRLWLAHDDRGHLQLAIFGPEFDSRAVSKRLDRSGPPTAAAGVAARRTVDRLTRYFDGDLDALELDALPSGTPFQHAVWRALRDIPPGTTSTYAAVAERIGRPRAVRAVGAANGANPLSMFIPCHRLVGAGGDLRGYAGGLDAKRWLLRHEGAPGFGEDD